MSEKYHHGVRVVEEATIDPPVIGTVGLQVVVGTAPVHLADDPVAAVNVPVLCNNMQEARKKLGYSVDFDTCGHVPYTHFQRALPYADTFLYDIKLLDPALHKRYTGVDNGLILENLKKLSGDGGKINLRLPLIGGVNATDEYIRDVIAFLRDEKIRVCRVNLLKYHTAGSGKYEKLGRDAGADGFFPPEDAWLERMAEIFRRTGFTNIHIGG